MIRRFGVLATSGFVAGYGYQKYFFNSVSAASNESPFSQKDYTKFTLKKIDNVNHNCKIFHFGFKNDKDEANLPICSCITCRIKDNKTGKDIVRPYTPVFPKDSKGEFQLLIKKYDNGIMSKHIHNMKIGDSLEFMGPWDKLKYSANMKKEIGLIAGGTGITPMLQLLETSLNDPKDKTVFTLLFGNVTEQDILLKDYLESLQKKYPKRFKLHYILDKPPKNWKGFSGYITPEILKKTMPAPNKDNLVCVCGPGPMVKIICGERKSPKEEGPIEGFMKDLGYKSEHVFKF